MSDATLLPGSQTLPARRARRSRDHADFAKSLAFSAGRGAALVGLAVIIGIALLQFIDDGTSGPIGDGGSGSKGGAVTTSTKPSGTTTTAPGGTTTTTSGGVRQPNQVNVLVLNGSGKAGAAGTMTNTLKSKGYQTGTPADATKRKGNIVYFKAGFERECTTVSTIVGGNAQVAAIPNPAPAGSENANCVVILGS
jgi:hypothetical protein